MKEEGNVNRKGERSERERRDSRRVRSGAVRVSVIREARPITRPNQQLPYATFHRFLYIIYFFIFPRNLQLFELFFL